MNNQKSKVWGFLFSLLPGAGHMYLGLMRQGVSFMTLFFGTIALAAFFNIPLVTFIIPIVWFYSFFDYMNKSRLPLLDFDEIEDKFLFIDGKMPQIKSVKFQKYVGWAAVLAGLWMIWDRIIYGFIDEFFQQLHINGINAYDLKQLLVAIIIVAVGVKLILGRKKQLLQKVEEDDECEPIE